MTRRSVITGIGHYLPSRIVTNDELSRTLDTNDGWIVERTGIHARHIAAEDEVTSDLAAHAARAALADAGIAPGDIDLIVVATATPDLTMPSTAVRVQDKLGVTHGAAFDVSAVCAGFVYALTVADSLLLTGQASRALVIGAETFSRIIDWRDRGTAILFGDGAGAVVLEAREGSNRGILASRLHTDGRLTGILNTDGGISTTRTGGHLRMEGKEVFRHAVAKMAESVREVAGLAGVAVEAIDWLVPHQANVRILNATAERLGLPASKAIVTVDRHANTSAASIPLALSVAKERGEPGEGQLVALTALGSGLTWGACLLRW